MPPGTGQNGCLFGRGWSLGRFLSEGCLPLGHGILLAVRWGTKLAGQLLSSFRASFQNKCLCKINGELRGKKLLCILG